MMRAVMIIAVLLAASPAAAAQWGTDYNMGTFAAGGGSASEGQLNLECGDPDAGIANYGELNLQLTIAAGVSLKAKNPLDYVQFAVGGKVLDMPMEIEDGSSGVLNYVHEAEGAALTQELVTAMRHGESVKVSYRGTELANVGLSGSNAALEAIDSCIRYRG